MLSRMALSRSTSSLRAAAAAARMLSQRAAEMVDAQQFSETILRKTPLPMASSASGGKAPPIRVGGQ